MEHGYGKRLRLFLKTIKIKNKELAVELNLTPTAISEWLSEKSKPDIIKLKKISELYFLNINWIITGEGGMFLELSREELKKQFLENLKWIDDFGKKILNGEIEITPEIEKKVAFIIETQKMILEKAKKEGYIIEK